MKRIHLKRISITLVLSFVSVFILLFFLPKPTLLETVHFSTAFYDEEQHLLRLTLSADEKYRLFTPLNEISSTLVSATLLQEDQYYWSHLGINPFSVMKAAWQTYVLQTRRIGASTITMQVARMRFGINSKRFLGKVLQVFRAIQLERHYTKREILEAYLNLAPYGGNIEGVGAASLIYFNKKADVLHLPEALALAVIPQNPSKRKPNSPYLQEIRDKLFARWLIQYPEDQSQQSLMKLPLSTKDTHALPNIAPHFVNHLLQKHIQGQNVTTTLNLTLQNTITRVTRNYIHRKNDLGVYNAAVLLVDTRDMGVKAALGSVNFENQSIGGQLNGTEIKRSPGSTLKPFIYALAFDQGLIHPHTVLKDVPQNFAGFQPDNFDGSFMGPIKAKDALILSRNIPAIELSQRLKHPSLYDFLEMAEVSHLKSETYYGLALSLGGVELTMQELSALYVTLVNDGVWHPLRMLQKDPRVIGKRLLSPEASFLVLDILQQMKGASKKLPIAWKTGTSSGYRDAWTVGSFGPYVLAVWIGNFNNQGNQAFVGKNIAAPLFFELIDAIAQSQKTLPLRLKNLNTLNLKQVEVCKASGMLPTRFCKDREKAWFIPGKSPIKTDTIYREIAIDPNTGLRTCYVNQSTEFKIFEFWPTDLLKVFKQAGIQPHTPPPYIPGCAWHGQNSLSPKITSPQADIDYLIRTNTDQETIIPLTAVADADVNTLYWFLNGSYLAKSIPGKTVFWHAKAGKFVLRVIDDHGLADVRDIKVQLSQ